MSNTHTMIANLKHAAWNKETVSIGGGTFDHKEVADFLGHYRAMQDALEAARLLCANLDNGGVGSATLVDNFRLQDDKV
jgi:hypothetical protein